MTAWSRSTASGGHTFPSSPTLPAGRPERLSHALLVPSPPPPPPTRLHSQKPPSIVCRRRFGGLNIYNLQSSCVFQDGGCFKQKQITVVEFVRPFEKTDHREIELTLTLHFLVVMLYTEQASLHHNEWGNVVMHKWGHWYDFLFFPFFFWKGPFCIENIHLTINPFLHRDRHTVDQKHVNRESVMNPCFLLRLSERFKFRLQKIQTSGPLLFFFFWVGGRGFKKWMYRFK